MGRVSKDEDFRKVAHYPWLAQSRPSSRHPSPVVPLLAEP